VTATTAATVPPPAGTGTVVPAGAVGSAGVLVASKAGSLLLQVAQLAVLARSLERFEFGAFAAAFALVAIVGAVAEAGLLNATVLSLADEPEGSGVLPASRAATVRVVAVAIAVVLVLAVLLLHGDARVAALALVPWLVLSRIDVPLVAHHQARYGAGRLAAAELTSRFVLLLAAVPVAVLAGSWTPAAVLVLIGAGYAVSELPSLAILIHRAPWRGRADPAVTRRLARRAVPLGLTNATSLIHARGDQVLLESFGRRSALAAYSLAYRVNDAVLALVHAAGMVSFPALAQSAPVDRARLGRRISFWGCMAGLAIGLGAALVGPALVVWLGGSQYADAGPLVRLLAVALAASVANLPLAQIVIVAGRTTHLLVASIAAVGVNVALNVALIPAFGARGSAAATIATEMGGLVCVAVLAHLAVPGSVPRIAVASIPVVFLSILLVGAVA
jgi:O-antigen/teichoic acid export membrane protein